MKVQLTRTKTSETFYIAKTYRDRKTGRSTSKIVRRLGTRSELKGMLPSGTDVMGWAKEEARRMTEQERGLTRKVTVSYDPARQIAEPCQYNGQGSVSFTSVTEEGEAAERCILSVDDGKLEEEASWDGFYGLATSLDDEDVLGIVKLAAGRWQVEECFRIMKGEFEARPVFLSRRDRIEAHFLTCFLALLIYRILEKRLGGRFSCPVIVDTLRGMQMEEVTGEGWRPLYMRTEVTDALHDAFGFRTDFEIVPVRQMNKIVRKTHRKGLITTKKEAGKDIK